jgi:hypothetical protein
LADEETGKLSFSLSFQAQMALRNEIPDALTLERWEAAIAPGDADDVVCNVRISPSLARMDEVSILRKDFLRLANNKEWLSDAVRIQCMVNIYLFD